MIDAAAEWGVTGDGEDSTAGFEAMHADMAAEPDRTWTIQLPRGHILTRMPMHFPARRVKLVGEDTTLQRASANRGLFSGSEPFRDLAHTAPYDGAKSTWYPGHRIASAQKSATKLTLLDDAAGLAIGPALLGGRSQQQQQTFLPPEQQEVNGYPANLRWFEWVEITDITDGVATVLRPLRFAYDQDWLDLKHPAGGGLMAGAPRLYSCNRPSWRMPERVEIEGIRFLRAAGSNLDNVSAGNPGAVIPAGALIYTNCIFEGGIFAAMAGLVRLVDCHIRASGAATGSIEIDKLLTRFEMLGGSVMGEIASRGGGCMEILLDGVQVTGHNKADGTHVYGHIAINGRELTTITPATFCEVFSLAQTHGGYFREGGLSMSVDARRV